MKADSARQSKAQTKAGDPIQQSSTGSPAAGNSKVAQAESHPSPTSLNSVSWRTPGIAARIAGALIGGILLRLWMLLAFPQASGDALIYGNIAKAILQGQYALIDHSGVLHSTLIRLPGYPLFLAACFRLFGIENYDAVAYLQIPLELGACLLLADFVRRISTTRAGLNTLWLSAMCPFTAVYTSAPLTESLTFDAICLALWSLQRYLYPIDKTGCPTLAGPLSFRLGWVSQILTSKRFLLGAFTIAISAAALLRPDGAILAFALWPALIFVRPAGTKFKPALTKAILCGVLSILPFAVWSARNWSTFHVFEPLAPRYANDPGEDPHLGWQHWVKTWCLDFTCTSNIYWNVPDDTIDFGDLPNSSPNPAYDSPSQKAETEALIADYNQKLELTPEIDARFGALARQRAAEHPFRTHLLLPLGRLADMTFRPRVENLTIDLRWWEYWNHRPETRFSYAYAAINLVFLILGLAGFWWRPNLWPYMAAYLVLRSLLLMTIEAPETRYTLEFFPVLFAMGGITLQKLFARPDRKAVGQSASLSPRQTAGTDE
jgi:hypothetical protein